MSKLFLVRHGDTNLNSRQRFWGKTDVELSPVGIRQAEQLRDRLAGQKIDIVYSSTLQRASKTADIIASPHKMETVVCPELQEINFGEFEGLTFEEIGQRFPEMAAQWLNWSVARFPGGESIEELNVRVSQFALRLQKHASAETVLVVAHSGVLRLLTCDLLGIDLRHWRQFRLDLGSLSIVDTYPQAAILSLLNDLSHLGK